MDTRIILVKSCQQFRARQLAVNETWAQALRDEDVRVLIMEGGHEVSRLLPNTMHLPAPDCKHGNRQKLRLALSLLLGYRSWDRVYVCDDDTFVHPTRWLAHTPTGDIECRLYTPLDHRRKKIASWPSGGSGWWMTRRACEEYIRHVTQDGTDDDVAMGWVMHQCKLHVVERTDLYGGDHYSGRNDVVTKTNTLIACHPVSPGEMRELWRILL
jgi:hypothetical protein